jgi:hypothetical protein
VISFDYNSGSITNTSTGVFNLTTNDAAILTNGGSGSFVNSGLLEKTLTTGTDLIQAVFTNNATGKVSVTSGTLDFTGGGSLGGTFATSGGGLIEFGGGTFGVSDQPATLGGAILISGATLSPGSGNTLTLSGADALGLASGGAAATFAGVGAVATSGTATVADNGSKTALQIQNGSVWSNAGTAIDQGVISFDYNSGSITNTSTGVFNLTTNDAAILTNGGSGSFVNSGLLEKTLTTGMDLIQAVFTNYASGTVSVASGTLDFTGGVTNLSGSTLTGGKWITGAGSTLQFAGSPNVLTNAADVTLNGAGSTFASINAIQTNSGALRILGGRSFSTAGAFSNTGTLQIGGGTFSTGSAILTNASTGTIKGFGVVSGSVTNAGTIEASGGLLDVAGAVTGTGSALIDAGATLELSAADPQTVNFNGAGATLKLDQPTAVAGAIANWGFGAGDRLDLVGISATNAALSGSLLVVTEANGATLAYNLSGDLSHDNFSVASDGHGGSFIVNDPVSKTANGATRALIISAGSFDKSGFKLDTDANHDELVPYVSSRPSNAAFMAQLMANFGSQANGSVDMIANVAWNVTSNILTFPHDA